MGSFWGMSSAGKDAGSLMNQAPNWNWEQFKAWLEEANKAENTGNWSADQARNFNLNRMNGGIGTPDEIWSQSSVITPGVDAAIAARQGRLAGLQTSFERMPKAADTSARIGENLQGEAANIQGNYGDVEKLVNDATGRMFSREDAASNKISGNLGKTYGDLGDAVNKDYGAMRKKGSEVYGGLKSSAEGTYDTAFKDIEKLNPAGEFAAARAGRSFAPMVSSALGRLRRGGVNTNGPQAVSAMQGVEAARARAMDDASAEGTRDYVNTKTNLGLSRQGARERLGLGELSGDTELSREQGALARDYSESGNSQLRDEMRRNLGAQQGIDAANTDLQSANLNRSSDRTSRWYDQQNAAAQLDRSMANEDFNTQGNLVGALNDEDLTDLGLKQNEFDRSMNYRIQDQASKAAGAAGLSQDAAAQYQQSLGRAGLAQGFGNTAYNQANQNYQREAQNAGWGKKLLAGVASAAAPLASAIPVVGPVVSAGLSAVGSGMGGSQQGGGYDWNSALSGLSGKLQGWYNGTQSQKTGTMQMPGGGSFGNVFNRNKAIYQPTW